MRTPLSPVEYVERERARLLARRGRQSVWALVRRLVREDADDLAAEVARVGADRGVVLPRYRTVAEQRALLKRVLLCLQPLVGTYTPPESASLFALLKIVDEWAEPTN
jgi:hypothetical protein